MGEIKTKSTKQRLFSLGVRLFVLAIAAGYFVFATSVHALDFAHDQTLTVPSTTSANRVGDSVAATSNYLASGSPLDDTLGADAGAVYLYEKAGSTWTYRQKITASDGAAGDQFGYSLAMNGTTLLVGSPYDDLVSTTDAGSVYSFDLDNGTWLQTEKITMQTPVNYERFGTSVDMTSTRAAVGVPGYNGATSATNFGRGAVSIWDRSGINWTGQYLYAYTSPITATRLAAFGYSVSISGDKIAAGAPRDHAANSSLGNAGSMSVITYNSGTLTWSSEARFIASTPVASDMYGNSVDIQGNTLVTANYAIAATTPRIYTYTFSGGSWSAATVIIPTTVASSSKRYIGQAMDIASDESSILIGSYITVGSTDFVGRVFVLKPNETTSVWEQAQEISSPTSPSDAGWFGYDVTYSGLNPVIGSPMVVAAANTRGAVYTYTGGDGTPPTITLSSTFSSYTNSSFIVTADLSEPVIGFAQDDITVTSGATIGNFTQVNPTQYTFRVSPSDDKQYTVGIDAGRMQDAAGNLNTASNSLVRTYDTTAPAATVLTPTQNTHFNTSTITASVRINDANGNLSGLTSDDITITNGTISDFSTSNVSTYITGTFTITPTSQGPITFYVEDGAVADQAGNASTASTTRTIHYDTAKPTPSFSISANPTNASPFAVTLNFDESVANINDVSLAQIAITNGTASNFDRVSDQQYTFDVTPGTIGTVGISYAANQVNDKAGNSNTAASLDVEFDNFGPEITIDSAAANPTNQAPITFSVTASEPITGLTGSDFDITNGTGASFTQQSSTNYTLVINPDNNGTVAVSLPAGRANDGVGNGNQLSNTKTVVYDTVRPSASITHSYISPTNASPLNYTIRFSEAVTDLTSSNISLTNATFVSLNKVDSREYTLQITPLGGTVTVRVKDSAVQDAAGNLSREDISTLTSDISAPTGTVNPLHTNNTRPALSGTISEQADSVTATINGTTFSATVNNSNLTWSVAAGQFGPLSDGTYNVVLAIVDRATNNGTDTTNNELVVDTDQPVLTISAGSSTTNQSPVLFNVSSSRDVSGLSASDFTVTGGTISLVTTIAQDTYEVAVSPTADGQITLQLNANTVIDDAGNQNPASNTAESIYDASRPSITLSSDSGPVSGPFDIAVTTSEEVQGLTAGDVSVTRGSVISLVKNSDMQYTLRIQPTTVGQVIVQIPAASATDAAGNTNTVSNSIQRLYDNVPPGTPTITSQVVEDRQPTLSGTFDAVNTSVLRVVVGSRTYSSTTPGTPLVLNGSQWELDFSTTATKLEFGVYDVRVTAFDAAGNSAQDLTQNELTINSAGTITGTVDTQITANTRPALSGTVSLVDATIKVKLLDNVYDAVNNRDGSWSLDSGIIGPLSDGAYNVELTFAEGNMEGTDTTTNELTIDTAAPRGTFTRIVTTKTSPRLNGTIDTTGTRVQIEIEGHVYEATVSGMQWSIAEGTINPALAIGVYNAIMYLERNGNQAVEVVRRAVTVQSETIPPVTPNPQPPTTGPTTPKPGTQKPTTPQPTSEAPKPEESKIKDEVIHSQQPAIKPVLPVDKTDAEIGKTKSLLTTIATACAVAAAIAGGSGAFLIGWKRRKKKDQEDQQMV